MTKDGHNAANRQSGWHGLVRTGLSVPVGFKAGIFVLIGAMMLAGCSSTPEPKAKFSPKKYGVKASPKVVASGQPVPKGGGRYVIGKKYKIAGKWYYPELDPDYEKVGFASWYGPTFHGRKTANGEIFDRGALTAAHPTMPLPSYARVTNVANGRSMLVRVNDRGPFHGNRVIDLSERVASLLGTKTAGIAKVKVEYVGPARLDGHDESYLMASLEGPGVVQPGATMPGTMLASVGTPAVPIPRSVPTPTSRPYDVPVLLASAAGSQSRTPQAGAVLATAYDPALAYEASVQTVQLASNNPFTAVTSTASQPAGARSPATATQNSFAPRASSGTSASGILGVLKVPAAARPQPIQAGSAVSSYAASGRISAAYQAIEDMSGNPITLSDLVLRR